jgi:hypothetical protein
MKFAVTQGCTQSCTLACVLLLQIVVFARTTLHKVQSPALPSNGTHPVAEKTHFSRIMLLAEPARAYESTSTRHTTSAAVSVRNVQLIFVLFSTVIPRGICTGNQEPFSSAADGK